MQPKIITKPGFKIIGIEVRTSNPDEMSGKGKIGEIWQHGSGMPGQTRYVGQPLPHSPYDRLAEVRGHDAKRQPGAGDVRHAEIPAGLVGREIPAAKYAVFTSARGAIPGVIMDVWKKIWDYKGAARAYQTDLEVYGKESRDPNNAQVEVYVSIR